ncbi:hypothetical protein HMPREF9439_01082 [Parasutterella excrementihominis YIT 11859]|uniref:Uncharacterized protein n=1 Tax=Parasutterella excrementihominis YIT 11859 TaxID=762966 RepID=F3QJI0_9BURK|nr:hypothetical protein HMPREF9439_01082 [Parasutterella excrementihominis YIT 11859]
MVFFSYLADCRCGSNHFSAKLQTPEATKAAVFNFVVFSIYF